MILSAKNGYHTEDSILIVADCGHEAWMSGTGQEAIKQTDFITVCFDCVDFQEVIEQYEKLGYMPALPGVRDAITKELGEAAADHVFNDDLKVQEVDPTQYYPKQ